MSAYFEELCRTMAWLSERPRAVFVGQAVRFAGTSMFTTLRDVPMEKRIEFPVAEDMQLGLCTGMALNGDLPISIYPRINFLLLAVNQLVLHLDKLPLYSNDGYRPKVIIRTAIATDKPLDPQAQHIGDYSDALEAMLKTVTVVRLDRAKQIFPAYRKAVEWDGPTLLIERTELYG